MPRTAALLAALALAACASPPPPPAEPAPAPAAPAADPQGARAAVDVALQSLSKRNFEAGNCAPESLKIVDEAAARAGEPIGDKCVVLVARLADKTWLVSVRPATKEKPSQAGGSKGLVTITPGAEGVKKIEYAK